LEIYKKNHPLLISIAKSKIKKAFKAYGEELEKAVKIIVDEQIDSKEGYDEEIIKEALQIAEGEVYSDIKDRWEDLLEQAKNKIETEFGLTELEHEGDDIMIVYNNSPFEFKSFNHPDSDFEVMLDGPTWENLEVMRLVVQYMKENNQK
jgi:hypothetical protein